MVGVLSSINISNLAFCALTVLVGRNTLNHTNAIEISYLCSTDFRPASEFSP
jgi:hypothetical protein